MKFQIGQGVDIEINGDILKGKIRITLEVDKTINGMHIAAYVSYWHNDKYPLKFRGEVAKVEAQDENSIAF